MTRQIHFNAFDMNCVGHQSPSLWAHPRDRSWQYKDLEYWTELAKLLERGKFDGIFRQVAGSSPAGVTNKVNYLWESSRKDIKPNPARGNVSGNRRIGETTALGP
jgi:hypothetical protein